MAYLEFEVVVIGIRAEADFFDDCFGGFGFEFFFLFLFLVKEFVEINDPYDWGGGIRGYFDHIQGHFFGPIANIAGVIDFAGFDFLTCCVADFFHIFADQANLGDTDEFVDPEGLGTLLRALLGIRGRIRALCQMI